jgi:hypothetical protein
MGGLRALAATELRLAALAGVALLAFAGTSALVAGYISDASTSPTVDLLLLTLLTFLMLVSSLLLAILLGDRIHGGHWRESVLRGRPIQAMEHDAAAESLDTEEAVETAVRRSFRRSETAVLSLYVVLAAVGHWLLLGALTGGFMEEYTRFGYYRTALRGADADKERQLLLEIADTPTSRLADHVFDVMVPRLDGPEASSRAAALSALAIVGERMARSVLILNASGGDTEQWEYRLADRLRTEVAPRARELLLGGGEGEAIAAARALGAFRDWDSVESLARLAVDPTTPGPVAEEAIIALGKMRDLGALEPLAALIRVPPAETRRYDLALWAVGELVGRLAPADSRRGPPPELTAAVELVQSKLPSMPPGTQCIAVDALRKMGDARSAGPLFALFEDPRSTFTCPDVEVPRPGEPPIVLSQREDVRIWILRAIALIAKGNDEVQTWLTLEKQRDGYYSEEVLRELRHLHAMTRDEDAP